MHTLIQHVFQRRKRLKERSKQPNPTGETQMAQVTYRGVAYDTHEYNAKILNENAKRNRHDLMYRGIKVNSKASPCS